MAIRIISPNGITSILGLSDALKVSSNDLSPNYLEAKLAQGSNITLTILNEGINEQIEISAVAGAGADTVKVSANDTTPGTLSQKLVAGTNITFTENNDGSNETLTIAASGGDASSVTFTPAAVGNWTGAVDPGNVDDALDQLASRMVSVENNFLASNVGYVPSTLTDWDSDVDPGNVDDALDQLASRLSLVEAGTVAPDASQVTYTPASLPNWGGSDPGNVDDALDYIANRVANNLIASDVGYTPTVLADWDSSADPGDVDGALDQLAERVTDLESTGGIGSVKISSDDTTLNFIENKLIAGTGIGFVVANPGGNETLTISTSITANIVSYTPNDVTDWNGNLDPGGLDDALDQLADRLKAVELSSTTPDASAITYTPAILGNWDGTADPGDVDDALDQLAARVTDNESQITVQAYLLRATATDTSPSTLGNKLVVGTGLSLILLNSGANEQLEISNLITDLADLTYTPALLTDWTGDVDPGDANDAVDQLASRLSVVENITSPDAADVTYTPTTVGDWTGDVDPGDVDNALDQLASRVETLEAGLDGSLIGYTPAVLADWNGSADPGQVDDALDQLADRVDTLENAPASDAGSITYTPNVLTDWDADTDPGNVDGALDQLAERVDDLESGTGGTPDAAGVTYTPADNTDWTGDVDPGNVDDALDQLAGRVDTLEAGSSGGTTGFIAQETVISQSRTIPDGHQTVYVGDVEVTAGGEIIVEDGGELIILPDEVFDRTDKIDHIPDTLSDWTGSADPGTAADAIDQLASRVQTLEGSVGLTNIYSYWDSDAPPLSPGAIDDEFDNGVVDPAWLSYDFGSRITSVGEDVNGLRIIANTTSTTEPVLFGRYKAIPGGDFTIYTKVLVNSFTANGAYAGLGLMQDATSSTGDVEFFGMFTGVGGFVVNRTYAQYNPSTNSQRSFHDYTIRSVYLRAQRNGTTYSFAHSVDGISWVVDPTGFTPAFTPQHICLIAGNTVAVTGWTTRFSFFRYIASDTGDYQPLPGRELIVKN